MPTLHRTTVDLILSAVHKEAGEDGMSSSFFFGTEPNAPHWARRSGATIFFSLKGMTEAALFVRRHGPSYLQALSIEDIRNMLQKFLTDNFHNVGGETFHQRFTESYAERVSEPTKEALAQLLAASSIFSPPEELSLFPLVPFVVEESFTSRPFFLRAPDTLQAEFDTDLRRQLAPDTFPPLTDYEHRTERPKAWLGVRSPILQASVKMKAAILGAAALTLPLHRRHIFSGREMFGGFCTINKGWRLSFGGPHTPALADDLIIRQCDQAWLAILAAKLASNTQEDRRHLRTLEYFYRAWPLGPSERFPVLCMALDAIYGEASQATQAVVDGVRTTLGTHLDEKRLRDLMKIRAAVIHGGAPDVYDSRKYLKYYQTYSADPIDDLDEVVTESLRRRIFGDALRPKDDPHAALIAQMQAEGRLPRTLGAGSILDAPPTTAGRKGA